MSDDEVTEAEALRESERLAREADRSFAKRHRDDEPPPAAKVKPKR